MNTIDCLVMQMTDDERKTLYWLQFAYAIKRVLIRTLRILIGTAFLFISYAFIEPSSKVADIPFASLTLGVLLSSIFSIGVCLGLFWLGLITIFGSGPSEHENAIKLIERAKANKAQL